MENFDDQSLLIPSMSPSGIPFLDDIGEEFVDRGYNVTFLPQNREVAAEAETDSVFHDSYLSSLVTHSPRCSLESLADKYGISSTRSFVFPQMIYYYESSDPSALNVEEQGPRYPPVMSNKEPYPYETYLQFLHKCLDFFDRLYEKGPGGNPVQYQGGEIIRRTLDHVSRHHGFDSVWMGFSPIPGKSGFYTDESSKWSTITESKWSEMTDDEIEEAKTYISDIREKKPTVRSGGNNKSSLLRIAAAGLNRLARGEKETIPKYSWRIKKRIRRDILSRYSRYRYQSLEESLKSINNCEYVFYPLQYCLESRIAMRAPAFFNQSWFIEYLSRSVPTNNELIIKDHPHQLGAQPRKAVDIITRYATAVSPSLNAHRVIKNSNVVVTLNNTVGYESLIYGKPVVTLGDAFYDDYTTNVNDINSLDKYIREAMNSGGLNEEKVIEFTHGLLSGSRDGVWSDRSSENIKNTVDGYLSVLERK